MKPDQHKKKRSLQYKKKHGLAQKTDASSTSTSSTKSKATSLSSAVKCATTTTAADTSKPAAKPKESGQNDSNQNGSLDGGRNRDFTQDESEEVRSFARRKIESNWDRYEPLDDDDVDAAYNYDGLKGADFKALLNQTGDASSQFRFKDEQLWEDEESDQGKVQESEGIPAIDCHDLSRRLMAIPLPIRLNIECSFFEPSTLKSFEDLASSHKESLDSKEAITWTPVSKDKSSLIFSAGNRVLDTEEDSDSICLDSDDEQEKEEEAAKEQTQPREEENLPPLELSVNHSQNGVKPSSLLKAERKLQDAPDTDKEPRQATPATRDVGSSLDKADHSEKDEMFANREDTAAEARKCSAGQEDKPETPEKREMTADLVLIQEEPNHSYESNNLQGHTKLPIVSPPVEKKKVKTKHLSEPRTDNIEEDGDDEDELNFLLGLENPVQSRNKPVVTGRWQLDEEGVADNGLLDEGQENSASHPEDADKKPKLGHVQAPLNSESTSQNGRDNLEAWLDSVLDD